MRTFGLAIVLASGLLLAACGGPGKDADAGPSGTGSASATATTPVPGTLPGQPNAAGKDITQADADALCAELNKGGAMASCELKDGQVVVEPKPGN